MPKKKSLNFIVDLKVYPFHVMFSFNQTDEELIPILDRYGIDHADAPWRFESDRVHGRTVMFGGNETLVRLPYIPTTCEHYGFLAHEIFHVVEFLYKKINIRHNVKSGECWAYLIGYITTEVFKHINKQYK